MYNSFEFYFVFQRGIIMLKPVSGYDVGALLYCPANSHLSIVESIKNEQFSQPFSLAFCLEDTVHDDAVVDAEKMLFHTLKQISDAEKKSTFYIPLIFVRIRSVQQLVKLAIMYKDFSNILTGFVIPKFYIENCDDYISAIQNLRNCQGIDYYYMPIFESASMVDLKYRHDNLISIREKLLCISDRILNIRVGANDFSNVFGLRRNINNTIYEIKPVSEILIDIVTTFATQYVVSGPVWEYYAGDGWDIGLRNEIEIDMLSGFVGKTIIHPKQIAVVNDMLKVSKTDFDDAYHILNWDKNNKTLVSSNVNSHRMNEYNTHHRWAHKILRLAQIYGIKE